MFESFSSTWFLAGGAALATLLVSCWSHVQNVYQQITSRVVMTVTVSGYQADAMLLFLKNKFTASRWGPRAYLGWMLFVRPRRRVQLVPMEITPPAGRLYWRGWRPLWVCRPKRDDDDDHGESGVTARDYRVLSLTLAFLRGTFDADQLVIDASEWYNRQVVDSLDTGGRRHYVKHIYGTAGKSFAARDDADTSAYAGAPSSTTDVRGCLPFRSLGWSFADLGPEQTAPGKAFDHLAMSADALELVQEARRWKASEDWYKLHGVPWRRGWLLYGPPGTGKTALARATAQDLDLPVFVYDLASLYNNELQQEWSRMLAEVPCMALIEDIDTVFDLRRNVSGRGRQHLTFDCLLNCIDGIERADGLFLVITTNRVEKIDPALGCSDRAGLPTRPGRIDRLLELKPLSELGRHKIAMRILAEWPQFAAKLVHEGDGDTAAQFQERCARRAMQLHFGDMPPDARSPAQVIGLGRKRITSRCRLSGSAKVF
jgi:hypothetical protein